MDKLNAVGLSIIFIILVIFFLAVIITLVLSLKYMQLERDLKDEEHRKKFNFEHNVLNDIVNSFKTVVKSNNIEVNTQAIIENEVSSKLGSLIFGERFLKNAVSLMIILGLMGTFYGLTLSIDKLTTFLQSDADALVTGLINSVQGMAVAFITSLFGIGCSVLLTIFNIIYSVKNKREDIMVQIEEYLDNYVAKEVKQHQISEYDKIVRALEKAFKEFGGRLEHDFRRTSEGIAANLVAATASVEHATIELSEGVQKFDSSLVNFSKNARDFSEFNYQLRTNIERMNITFADFIEALRKQKNTLQNNE